MRGAKVETQGLFSYVSPEQRVPQDHPLRVIRAIVDRALAGRGRNSSYPLPPAQIRTSGITAYGSYLKS